MRIVLSGTPQETVLGTLFFILLLFFLYVNEIVMIFCADAAKVYIKVEFTSDCLNLNEGFSIF